MGSEFVTGQIDRLTLGGDGRWVDVKHELSAGEAQAMLKTVVNETPLGSMPTLSPENVLLAKVIAYVVGWSFTNGDGHPVPVTGDSIANLRQRTFEEVSAVVEAHEQSLKKTAGGVSA